MHSQRLAGGLCGRHMRMRRQGNNMAFSSKTVKVKVKVQLNDSDRLQ
jgi:hypothetical protein